MRRAFYLAGLGLPLLLAGCAHREVVAYAVPPPAYSETMRQGFRDGAWAARHDLREGRRPDVDDHERFRHPPVPGEFRADYRHGFRDGYRQEMGRAGY